MSRARPVTVEVDAQQAADLVTRRARACAAFTGPNGPELEPVHAVVADGERYLVGLSPAARVPGSAQELVLLLDAGSQFFDLRGLYVRGTALPSEPPPGLAPDLAWFAVTPSKVSAWDYGKMREASDAA